MDKKEKIIEVALQLFAEHGFEKTPISTICEQAEISKGSVFHHFKNKNELLRAVFTHMTDINNNVDQQDEHLTSSEGRLEAMIDSIFVGMTIAQHRKMYHFNFSVMVHPTTRNIVLDLIEERYQGLQASTEEVFRALSHPNPSVVTRMLIATIHRIMVSGYFYPPSPLLVRCYTAADH
ncbi:putative acrEF/envCD operon repressor [Vibrio thalassae]|uniref:Putative acrEF/envCD operon repressor n=2 Tax=Vibrio thalassae TaxID=1243014 RepID=A0A240EKM0_9VIBR|nr:putative acrEF/envCD operon repressor [Vibrio thalassae]